MFAEPKQDFEAGEQLHLQIEDQYVGHCPMGRQTRHNLVLDGGADFRRQSSVLTTVELCGHSVPMSRLWFEKFRAGERVNYNLCGNCLVKKRKDHYGSSG